MPYLSHAHTRLSLGKVFWRETGQGEAIIFLHGTWQDSSQWSAVLDYLGDEYHCFALDLLGCGESDRPKIGYSIALQVEYLREYLARLNLHQVYLVGHSLGAWVAVSYGLQHPEQVKGLVLLSPEGVQPPELARRWLKARILISPLPIIHWGLKFMATWVKLLGIAPQIPELLKLRQKLKLHPIPCRLLFQRRPVEIHREMVDRYLENLKVPTLLLQTTGDEAEATALIHAYASLAPTAELQKLAAPTNNSVVSPEQELAREIQRFFGDISQNNYPDKIT
jgi:pimeloyl-ACP methyl ester carboxylesterase